MSGSHKLDSRRVDFDGAAALRAQPPPLTVRHPPEEKNADPESATATVGLHSAVVIRYLRSDEVEEYTLVPPSAANILHYRISTFSPMGRAVYGKRVGDIVEVEAPGGMVAVRIEAIRKENEEGAMALEEAGT